MLSVTMIIVLNTGWATASDPQLFDKLQGRDVRMWEAYFEEVDYSDYPGLVVGGGSAAPVAAVTLAIMKGHTQFEFYGVDGGNFEWELNTYDSYDMDDVKAGIDPALFDEHVFVETNQGVMKVATNFWRQHEELRRVIDAHPECSFKFHGDSLNSLVFNKGLEIRGVYTSFEDDGPKPEA